MKETRQKKNTNGTM